ncbi:MAG: LysE family translocator [Pseudomonadota bacterium]|nr:LysE family translocator [Pseudomonadota bacterium]
MLTFALAAFFLFITPGPGVLSAAGVGSAYGYRKGVRYFIGLFLGTNLVAVAVISGLAAVMLSNPALRTFFFGWSVLYLLYLAFRIAFSGSKIAFRAAPEAPGVVSGIMLQVVNPKAYAVATAFFTGFPFWPESLAVETAIKLGIMNAIWFPIHLGWFAAGVTVRRLDLAPRTQFIINIIMALAMLAVVALAALGPL